MDKFSYRFTSMFRPEWAFIYKLSIKIFILKEDTFNGI